jgi:hypothetical protein
MVLSDFLLAICEFKDIDNPGEICYFHCVNVCTLSGFEYGAGASSQALTN